LGTTASTSEALQLGQEVGHFQVRQPKVLLQLCRGALVFEQQPQDAQPALIAQQTEEVGRSPQLR
jgi:hypothetical protein